MGFDPNKVQFTAEELDRIGDADAIYETVAPAIADGLDWSDLGVFAGLISEVRALVQWLMTGTKLQLGYKLIALGAGLVRDNEFLGTDPVE